MAHDVFISHSAKDKPIADAVCAGLESKGVRCWIAPRDVLPGTEWVPAIIDAIGQSKLMVLVYSANANESPQVSRELARAVERGVIIVPFRIEDAPLSPAMAWYLEQRHWLDALTPPMEQHIESLATTAALLLKRQGGGEAAGGIEQVLAQARQAQAEGRHGDAVALARRVQELEPGYAQGTTLLDAATRALETQRADAERRAEVARLIGRARLALDDNHYDEVVSLASRALQIEPGNREAELLRQDAIGRPARSNHDPWRPWQRYAGGVASYMRAHPVPVAAGSALLLISLVVIWRITSGPSTLALDEQVSAALAPWNRTHLWQLVLASPTDFRVELTNLPSDYDLYVTGPDGRRESSTRGGQENDTVPMAGAHAGTYVVEVSSGAGEVSREPYQLAARRGSGLTPTPLSSPGLTPRTLTLDEPVTGVLSDQDRSHRYQATLPSPADFRIVELTNLPADYDLYVTGPTGRRSSSARMGLENDFTPIGGAPGVYEVEVRASLGTTASPYRLLLRQPRSGDVLLSDDFSDPAKAVLATSSSVPQFTVAYERDEYAIRKMDPDYDFLPTAYFPGIFRDASITVDARILGQTQSRYISLGCRDQRTQAGSSEYRFSVDPEQGTFVLARWDLGSVVNLVEQQTSTALRRGNEVNRLELSCTGATVSARINGTQVASVEDATYRGGQLWIGAASYVGTRLTSEARFTNLVVTQ